MNQIDSYVYLLGTYALLYSLAYVIYQRFKSRVAEPADTADSELQNPEGSEYR